MSNFFKKSEYKDQGSIDLDDSYQAIKGYMQYQTMKNLAGKILELEHARIVIEFYSIKRRKTVYVSLDYNSTSSWDSTIYQKLPKDYNSYFEFDTCKNIVPSNVENYCKEFCRQSKYNLILNNCSSFSIFILKKLTEDNTILFTFFLGRQTFRLVINILDLPYNLLMQLIEFPQFKTVNIVDSIFNFGRKTLNKVKSWFKGNKFLNKIIF